MSKKLTKFVLYELTKAYEPPFRPWILSSILTTLKILLFGFIAANIICLLVIYLSTDPTLTFRGDLFQFIKSLWFGINVFSDYFYFGVPCFGVLLVPWIGIGLPPDTFNKKVVAVGLILFIALMFLEVQIPNGDDNPYLWSGLIQALYLTMGLLPFYILFSAATEPLWKFAHQTIFIFATIFYLITFLVDSLTTSVFFTIIGVFGRPGNPLFFVFIGGIIYTILYSFIVPFLLESIVALHNGTGLRSVYNVRK